MEFSNVAVRTACNIQVNERHRPGRPKITREKLMENDCYQWIPTTVNSQERNTLRSSVRSAMCAASHVPGRGPSDGDDAPAY